MPQMVIVAIPEKEDTVWKISSEPVPHMTILNLGDQEPGVQTAKILSYLEHAVETMLHRFRMSVDHRGTLGPKKADVLFFDKSYCEKQVKEFREALLKNPDVLELYNGAEQFHEWVPHLTLGFPETPAHPDTRDYANIYGVGFGKIALWVDNYDGPEIELTSCENEDELLMSEIHLMRDKALAAIAAHQENSPAELLQKAVSDLEEIKLFHAGFDEGKVNRGKGGKFAKKGSPGFASDAEWMNPKHLRELHNQILVAATEAITANKQAILKKYGLKPGDDITKNPEAHREQLTNVAAILNKEAKSIGVSPSGGARINFAVNKDGTGIYKSAVLNNDVHRVGGRRVVPTAKHSIEDSLGISLDQKLTEEDLLQFGTSGMKWGVRKDRSGSIRPRATLGLRDRRAQKWQATADTKAYGKVYGRAAGSIRKGTRELNKNSRFAGKDFKTDSPLRREYYSAYSKMVTEKLNSTVSSRSMLLPWRQLGMSPNKRLELNFHYDVGSEARPRVTVRRTDTRKGRKATAEHDEMDPITDDLDIEVNLDFDDDGYIQDLVWPDPEFQHVSNLLGISLDQKLTEEDILQFGRIGMKWGVSHPRGANGLVNIEGVSTKKAMRRIQKAGGVHKLTSEDLKKLTDRINLENNYAKAVSENSRFKAANVKVRTALDLGKSANDAIKFYNSDAGQLLRATIGKDSHAGKHNKLNQPIDKLLEGFAPFVTGGKGGGKGKGGKRKKE